MSRRRLRKHLIFDFAIQKVVYNKKNGVLLCSQHKNLPLSVAKADAYKYAKSLNKTDRTICFVKPNAHVDQKQNKTNVLLCYPGFLQSNLQSRTPRL